MKFIVFDTEDDSYTLQKRGLSGWSKRVTQIAAIGPDGKRFHLRPKVSRVYDWHGIKRYEMDIEPFLNWCRNYSPCIVYAHNLQYDLGNLWADNLDAFDVSMVGGRIVKARWNKLEFRDSFNIWPMALKKLGKAVGLEKGELDEESEVA